MLTLLHRIKRLIQGQSDPYWTHCPVLAQAVMSTTGNVVECGGGLYSTPLLKQMLADTNRNLLTIESDPKWVARMFSDTGPHHTIIHGHPDPSRWGECIHGILSNAGLVFIDWNPWEHRSEIAEIAAHGAGCIVIHDYYDGGDVDLMLDASAYSVQVFNTRPDTLVARRCWIK